MFRQKRFLKQDHIILQLSGKSGNSPSNWLKIAEHIKKNAREYVDFLMHSHTIKSRTLLQNP